MDLSAEQTPSGKAIGTNHGKASQRIALIHPRNPAQPQITSSLSCLEAGRGIRGVAVMVWKLR